MGETFGESEKALRKGLRAIFASVSSIEGSCLPVELENGLVNYIVGYEARLLWEVEKKIATLDRNRPIGQFVHEVLRAVEGFGHLDAWSQPGQDARVLGAGA